MPSRRQRANPITIPAALVLSALVFFASAFAGSGGSVYSRFGIGDLSGTTAGELLGLGGTGMTVMPLGSVNDLNPAAWAGIGKIRFSAGALYQGYSTDDGAASAYLAGMRFNGFGFAIPLSTPNGITFAGGVLPYSRVDYTVITDESRAGLDYNMTYRGDGGISRAYAGLSVSLASGLHAGGRIEYLFGSMNYSMLQRFPTSSYAGTELTRSEHIRGFGSTVGLLYEGFGELLGLGEDRHLAIGAAFSPTTYPTAESERVYNYDASPSSTPPDSSVEGESTFKVPFAAAGGISYRTSSLLLAMDVRYQKWEGSAFETYPGVGLRNSVRVSAGVRFLRDVDPNPAISRKATYSFGLFHDGGYLEVRNTGINENGITAGISFPILNETRLSFAAAFSVRGTTDGLLQQEKIFRFSASMDITELWFQRPVEE